MPDFFNVHKSIPNFKGAECKFVQYIPGDSKSDIPDLHVIKEVIHFTDGTSKPNLRIVENYQRPFWITKKGMRNHQDKKENEALVNVDKFYSNELDLQYKAAKLLGLSTAPHALSDVNNSPYLYGSSISAASLITHRYRNCYKDLLSANTKMVLDIETDMVDGTEEIIMCSVTMGAEIYTAVVKSFFNGVFDPINRLKEMVKEHLGDVFTKRNITDWKVIEVDTPLACVKYCLDAAHRLKPDFLAFWNINFDLPKIIECIEKAGENPAMYFSDPSIPVKYRYFKYIQGKPQKVTASGKMTPIKPADQWHTAICPSSFYLIDSMCVYRAIRQQSQQDEPTYSLDYILNKLLKRGKLNIEAAAHIKVKAKWHTFMQMYHKLEYTVYNLFDCIGVEMLDDETQDLMWSLPVGAGISEFRNFKSQPRRLCDALHFFFISKEKCVIGVSGDEMHDEIDDETIGREGWIVALKAHLKYEDGAYNIKDFDKLMTLIQEHVAD